MKQAFCLSKTAIRLLCVFVIFGGICCGVLAYQNRYHAESDAVIPEDVSEFLGVFLETCKNNPEDAVMFCHFEDDFEREAYVLSDKRLVDYEVLEATQVADDVYAFKLHLAKEHSDIPERYYFVCRIDGELYLMNNVYNIPKDMLLEIDEQMIKQFANTGGMLVQSSSVLK